MAESTPRRGGAGGRSARATCRTAAPPRRHSGSRPRRRSRPGRRCWPSTGTARRRTRRARCRARTPGPRPAGRRPPAADLDGAVARPLRPVGVEQVADVEQAAVGVLAVAQPPGDALALDEAHPPGPEPRQQALLEAGAHDGHRPVAGEHRGLQHREGQELLPFSARHPDPLRLEDVHLPVLGGDLAGEVGEERPHLVPALVARQPLQRRPPARLRREPVVEGVVRHGFHVVGEQRPEGVRRLGHFEVALPGGVRDLVQHEVPPVGATNVGHARERGVGGEEHLAALPRLLGVPDQGADRAVAGPLVDGARGHGAAEGAEVGHGLVHQPLRGLGDQHLGAPARLAVRPAGRGVGLGGPAEAGDGEHHGEVARGQAVVVCLAVGHEKRVLRMHMRRPTRGLCPKEIFAETCL